MIRLARVRGVEASEIIGRAERLTAVRSLRSCRQDRRDRERDRRDAP